MANAVLPPGRFIRAASHTKAAEEAHATSRVLVHLNLQVRRLLPVGRVEGSVTSAAVRSITVLSLVFASFHLLTCSAVNTSLGFNNSPEPTIIWFAGASML